MLLINSIKPENHNLTDIYYIKLHQVSVFFNTNYFKRSNNFAANAKQIILSYGGSVQSEYVDVMLFENG